MAVGHDPRNFFGKYLFVRARLLQVKPVWQAASQDPRNYFGRSVLGKKPDDKIIDSYSDNEYIVLRKA